MSRKKKPTNDPQVEHKIKPIAEAVAKATGVSEHDMRYGGKAREYLFARRVLCWAIRELTDLSYPEFARHVGYRTHTGAIDAVRRAMDTRDPESAGYDQAFDEACNRAVLAVVPDGGDE